MFLELEGLPLSYFTTATQVEETTPREEGFTILAEAELKTVQSISRKSEKGEHTASISLAEGGGGNQEDNNFLPFIKT